MHSLIYATAEGEKPSVNHPCLLSPGAGVQSTTLP